MGPTGSGANDSNEEKTPLICGLPDDIAILCLARVPRTYHANLKCVSKRWRELVCGDEWRIIRKKYNLEETWIYAFCEDGFGKGGITKHCCYVLDPYAPRRYWKRIRDLPPCIVQRQCMRFEVLGQKAYLIGGRDMESMWADVHSDDDEPDIADEVYCYDAITNSWTKAAPLSTPRCLFASEVLDGKIYAVGSLLNLDGKHTWETYDPITNIWTAQSYPRGMDCSVESIVYNGKLYVRNAPFTSDPRFGVYDPSTGTWQDVDKELVSGWHGTSFVVADGRLYAFNQMADFKLTVWEEDRKEWTRAVELSSYLMQLGSPLFCRLVAVGKSIFFIGKGLFTVALDVGKGGGGLLISDVAEPFSVTRRALICKCMTI